jgi:molybdopterin synthase catalytic subunit
VTYLQAGPLDIDALMRQVAAPDRGAVVVFVGAVRNHHAGREVSSLAYSAYGPMAEAICEEIIITAGERWPVAVALAHRVGKLVIGESSVVVVAAAAHRGDAFDACRWVIDELKQRVPIWKREQYRDGTEAWVDPTATHGVTSVEPE